MIIFVSSSWWGSVNQLKMNKPFVGRDKERKILEEMYQSSSSELVSITGRRRVGKTFLVRHVFENRIDFDVIGSQFGDTREQLLNFNYSLSRAKNAIERSPTPKDWQLAFFELEDYLRSLGDKDRKKVIFIDEIPWLAANDPLFIRSFSHFWNSYAEWNNVLVIICGSAASWIVRKIIRDRGGLHNRVTKRIYLKPYTLAETERYFQQKNIQFNRYSIVQVYMVTGGIPFYLNEFKSGESVPQSIDRICFEKNGLLNSEFKDLYLALFDDGKRHVQIVRALANSPYGLSRQQIVAQTKLSNGGTLSDMLEELVFCGFILELRHFSKRKKGKIYRLVDEYSLFYIRFIEPMLSEGKDTWMNLVKEQAYVTWTGYAFENLGFTHLTQIKKALGVSGVLTSTYAYQHAGNEHTAGVQIDMVIERKDNVINLCEFKFYKDPVNLSINQAEALRQRETSFRELTKSKSILFTTMVAPFGITTATNVKGVIQQTVMLDDLFEEGS